MEKTKIIKYSTWNVRGIANREEELDNALDEKQIETAALTESKKEFGEKMETIT